MIEYNVLWVDDDDMLGDINTLEPQYGLSINQKFNWEDAYKELQDNYEKYDAIILDAYCKFDKDSSANESFLERIKMDLGEIMGKKLIPWYTYSAGAMNMNNYTTVIQELKQSRKRFALSNWGEMDYVKNKIDNDIDELEKLFTKIKEVASHQHYNVVKQRFEDVFKYIGLGKIIDHENNTGSYKIMLDALCAMLFPERMINYKYRGNDLRQVLESIIDAAYNYKILPEVCYESNHRLSNSCKYLSGIESCGFKYGEGDESIFPEYMGYVANSIRIATSPASHSMNEIDKDKFNFDNKKCLYFGYIMVLCDMIKWFGDLVSNKNELEIIKKNVEKSKKKDDLIVKDDLAVWKGKLCSIECDMDGDVYGVSENQLFKVKKEAEDDIGKQVEIVKVLENTRAQQDKYSLFLAKYKVIE